MMRNLTILIVSVLLFGGTIYAQNAKFVEVKKDVAPRIVTGFDDSPSFYEDFKNRQIKINRLLKNTNTLPTDLILENYDWLSNSYQPPLAGAFDFTGDGKYDPFAIITGNTLLQANGTANRYAVFGYIDDLGVSTYLPYGFDLQGFSRRTGWNSHLISDKANGIVYLAIYDFLRTPSAIRDFVWKIDMLTDPTVATQITTEAGALAGGWARFALDGNGIFWEVVDNSAARPLNIAASTDGGVTFAVVDSVGSNDPKYYVTDFGNDPAIMAYGNKISYINMINKSGTLAKLGYRAPEVTDPDSADGFYHWYSTDGGNTWKGEMILRDGDNVITNRPLYEPDHGSYDIGAHIVDPKGVTHVVVNGFNSLGLVGADTINVYPVLYWNDVAKNWISLELPAVEQYPATRGELWDNAGICGRPFVQTDSTGNVVVVMWARAQFSGTPGASTINTFTGGATVYAYYDIVYSYSLDKGVTWSTPVVTDREVNKAFIHPTIAAIERRNDSAYVHYTYYYDEIPGSFVLSQNAKSVNNVLKYNMQKFYAPSVGVNDNVLVNNFVLEQNYPNPFNPSTKISYSITERSNVSIKVFDMLGREVAELVNSNKEAGSHEITFDASNLASGLYIYTIKAGSFTASKKMMLMK